MLPLKTNNQVVKIRRIREKSEGGTKSPWVPLRSRIRLDGIGGRSKSSSSYKFSPNAIPILKKEIWPMLALKYMS